jgi:hypothetical protein
MVKSLREFKAFYESDLMPVLQSFESRRKRILKSVLITLLVVAVLAVAVILSLSELRHNPTGMVVVGVVGVLVVCIVGLLVSRGFVHDFKVAVVGEIVKFVDPSLNYAPKNRISEHKFRGSRIFEHRIDRYRGEDYVAGKLGATEIEFSEIHAEYKTVTHDSKGRRHTHWHTIFKGLFFIADFNKDFANLTVVLPDTAEKIFGFLGKSLQNLNFTRGELVKLEDPEFEKEFVVYGDDQVEARYILSTSLMQRITEFKRKTKCPIFLSFVNSSVHVAIRTGRNMFEPRMFRTLLKFEVVREYLQDLQLALGIVEDLNLNTRIWTKE